MSWLLASILNASVMGPVSIIDKFVLHRYANTPLTLLLLSGTVATTAGFLTLSIIGIPNEATLGNSVSAISSGLLFGCSGTIVVRVLYRREVSRTIPITQSAPIFAALLAFLLLGENISFIQWGGIIIAVLGSVLISLKIDDNIHGIFLHKSFYLLMLSAFLLGAAMVVGKLALEELPVLYTYSLRMLTFGVFFLSVASRAESFIDIKSMFSQRSPALVLVIINECIIVQLGQMILLWSLSLGPASLVSAVVGTRALFTVFYSMVITKFWRGALGEENSTGSVLTKLFSTALIVVGVITISI
jgi:uncharacterized membrane protein